MLELINQIKSAKNNIFPNIAQNWSDANAIRSIRKNYDYKQQNVVFGYEGQIVFIVPINIEETFIFIEVTKNGNINCYLNEEPINSLIEYFCPDLLDNKFREWADILRPSLEKTIKSMESESFAQQYSL